jgi:hypothetical protein
MQDRNNEDQEVLEQASDEDIKLELNDGREDDSFHAKDFMEDDEVEENPELGRKDLDNRRQSMEEGLAREGILNTLRKFKHKKKKSKTPSPKRGSNIPKRKHGGVNAPTTRTGVGKSRMRTATDTAPNPKPRQC